MILAGYPDFLKIYLLSTDRHELVTQRTDTVGDRGLDPKLVPRLSRLYGSTPTADVFYLQRLGVFTNAELLNIWCEATPQTIFPRRKLGKLQDG